MTRRAMRLVGPLVPPDRGGAGTVAVDQTALGHMTASVAALAEAAARTGVSFDQLTRAVASLAETFAAPVFAHVQRPDGRWGRLTVEGERAYYRMTGQHLIVRLDGLDMTEGCTEADDVEGWIERFVKYPDGGYVLTQAGEPIRERHFGVVTISEGTPTWLQP